MPVPGDAPDGPAGAERADRRRTYLGAPRAREGEWAAGTDVAILGAAAEDAGGDRPGTGLAPRAVREASRARGAPRAGAAGSLRMVDAGDAAVAGAPADVHDAIRIAVARIARDGAVPLLLGGHHAVADPLLRACADVSHGPLGLVHLVGGERSPGAPLSRLVELGVLHGARCVRLGTRGAWRDRDELRRQGGLGVSAFSMHDIRRDGIDAVTEAALGAIGGGPVVLVADAGVLDPEALTGTGAPEPGGLSLQQLLAACRTVAAEPGLAGCAVVELCPQAASGRDPAAIAGQRIVDAVLAGVVARRQSMSAGRFRRSPAAAEAPASGRDTARRGAVSRSDG